MLKFLSIAAVMLPLGCGGPKLGSPGHPGEFGQSGPGPGPNPAFFDSFFQFAEIVDDNTLWVYSRAPAGAGLGQCATPYGAIEHCSCLDEGVDVQKLVEPFRTEFLAKAENGLLTQFTRVLSSSASGSAGLGPVSVDATGASLGYEVVYDWSRSATLDLTMTGLRIPSDRFVVSKVEVGVALRMTLEVRMRMSELSGSAAFGIGRIAVALENRTAEVSGRYEVAGVTKDFLPDKPLRISSAADLYEAISEFHSYVADLKKHLHRCEDVSRLEPCPPDSDESSCTTAKDCRSFPLATLAYYPRGSGIAGYWRERARRERDCLNAQASVGWEYQRLLHGGVLPQDAYVRVRKSPYYQQMEQLCKPTEMPPSSCTGAPAASSQARQRREDGAKAASPPL